MLNTMRHPITVWKGIFYLLLAVGAVVTVQRYAYGLGAVTNLSDQFPWGLWVGFDVLCGVGLAAGGFTITALVYLLNAKRFQPIVRPTVLTAFLGYLMVVVALLYDLGRPWNLWHPLVMWNTHSVMFEVSWCVTLYTTVLALEVSGMVFERLGWRRAQRIQRNFTLPLVVAGVLLSTLHQSSLGAFYLIVPGKLHAFWYSSALPWLFWLSSIAVGLAMVIIESRLSSRAFGRALERDLLADVGRLLTAALGVYGAARLYDLWRLGALRQLSWSYESGLLAVELVLGLLAPLAILARARWRRSPGALYAAALLTVAGFVCNRLNVTVTGFESTLGLRYVPAWSEVAITLMLVALGFAAFRLAVRRLPVFPSREVEAEPPTEEVAAPRLAA
jgi:Ni/Fe-hydrogenase subunit HybB-like protein